MTDVIKPSQWQLERRAHDQARPNGRFRVAGLPALSIALPLFQCGVLDPQSQVATLAQPSSEASNR